MIDIKEELFKMQDLGYKDFNSKLIPNINPDTVIGVRTPELRAFAKQYDAAIPYIEKKLLPVWVHNKTIQKAIESYRITDEQRSYLRALRIK